MSIALNASLRRVSVSLLSGLFALALLTGSASLAKEEKAKTEKTEKAQRGEKTPTVVIADEAALLVVVNKADAKTLVLLPGIGKKTAERVVEGRPYKQLDDLKKVKGIAEKRLAKVKGCVGKTKVPESLFAEPAE